jgi:hypothetical protein
MSRRFYSHFIVLRGGVPCTLFKAEGVAPKGILVPTTEHPPTEFVCNRNDRSATTYARRRMLQAINRTDKFLAEVSNSLISEHPFVLRAVAAGFGLWQTQAFLCPPKPKPSPSPLVLKKPPISVRTLK